jgi:hypothetical protein
MPAILCASLRAPGEPSRNLSRTILRFLVRRHSHGTTVSADQRLFKKAENHAAAVALYSMYYNFGRVHQALRVTPAMEAGVATQVWSVEEIVALLR